jgi:hypothetical protein
MSHRATETDLNSIFGAILKCGMDQKNNLYIVGVPDPKALYMGWGIEPYRDRGIEFLNTTYDIRLSSVRGVERVP